MAEANGNTYDHEKAALVGEHLEGGHDGDWWQRCMRPGCNKIRTRKEMMP